MRASGPNRPHSYTEMIAALERDDLYVPDRLSRDCGETAVLDVLDELSDDGRNIDAVTV